MANYPEIAFNIINNFLHIRKDNVISISGEIHNEDNALHPLIELPIIEELALAIRKRHAFPVLELSTQKLKERFFEEIPEDLLRVPPYYYNSWMDTIDIFIEVSWKSLTDDYDHKFKEKYAALKEHTQKIWEKIFQQNKKMLFLNFPTYELAKCVNTGYENLRDSYLNALNCNYSLINNKVEEYRETYLPLSKHIIQQDECILVFKLGKSEKFPVIREQIIILPSGHLEFPIDRHTMEGIFQADKVYHCGLVYKNVRIAFENGAVRYINFKNDVKGNYRLQNCIMNSGPDVNLIIGFNNSLKQYTNYYYYDRNLKNSVGILLYDQEQKPIMFSGSKTKIS